MAKPTPPPIPTDCKRTILDLVNDVAWLNNCWQVFRSLYMHDQERYDTLFEHGNIVFGVYQYALTEATLLQIAKLLAKPATGSKGQHAVVSLERGIIELPNTTDPATRARLLERADLLRRTYSDIIAHRDRRIAHNDLAIVAKVETLNGIKVATVESAITAVSSLLNDISVAFNGTGRRFGDGPNIEEQVQYMVSALRRVENPSDE